MKYSVIAICIVVLMLYIYEKHKQNTSKLKYRSTIDIKKFVNFPAIVEHATAIKVHRSEEDALRCFGSANQPRLIVTEPSGLLFTVTGTNLNVRNSKTSLTRVFVNTDDVYQARVDTMPSSGFVLTA